MNITNLYQHSYFMMKIYVVNKSLLKNFKKFKKNKRKFIFLIKLFLYSINKNIIFIQ